jgi:hypothetical protein
MVWEVTGSSPPGGRIVKDNGRPVDQGASDGNAAAHAAGKLGRITIDGLFHFDEAQRFADARIDFFFVGIFLAQAEGNIFSHGHGIEERALLKNEANFAAEIEQFLFGHGGYVVTHHQNASGVGANQSGGHFHEQSFSGSRLAEENFGFTVLNVEGNAVQHVAVVETDGNIAKRDEGRARSHFFNHGMGRSRKGAVGTRDVGKIARGNWRRKVARHGGIIDGNSGRRRRRKRGDGGSCSLEKVQEQFGDESVDDQDENGGDDDGGGGGAAHALGATFYAETFVAADGGDDQAKDERLGQALDDVADFESVHGAGPELDGAEAEGEVGDEESAAETDKIRDYGEQREHEHSGDDAGRDQFADGIGAEGAHGVDLLGDDHRTQFRGDAGSVAAGDEQGGDGGTELADQGEGYGIAGESGFAELFELRRGLQHHHSADEKAGENNNRQRTDADEVHLLESVEPIARGGGEIGERAEGKLRVLLHAENLAFDAVGENGEDGGRVAGFGHRVDADAKRGCE